MKLLRNGLVLLNEYYNKTPKHHNACYVRDLQRRINDLFYRPKGKEAFYEIFIIDEESIV